MRQVVDILATPADTFVRIKSDPRVWRAWTIYTVVFFVLGWLTGCWQDLKQAFMWSNILGPALLSPLIVGIVSLGTTALLYLLSTLLGDGGARSTNFRTLYSMNIHCGMIFLLGEVVNFLLVRTDILGEQPLPLRGRFPVGLDALLLGMDDPSLYVSVILHSTSVFLIWYLVVLSLGIHIVTGTSKARAAAIAATLWCVLVLFALGMVYAAGGGTTIHIKL